MSLTISARRVGAFIALIALIASCNSNTSARGPQTTTSKSSVAAVPIALSRFGIGRLDTTPIPGATRNLLGLSSDGAHLYSRLARHGIPTRFVRLDPRTGRIVASYAVRQPPPDSPFANSPLATGLTDAGIVALDGDRTEARILDPVTLKLRHVVKLPAGSRTDMPTDVDLHGPLWLGHQLWSSDQIVGRNTLMGVTRVVPLAGSPQTRPVPPCGSKGGVQPTSRLLVINLECAYQIAIIDLSTNHVYTFPSFFSRVDVTMLGSDIWAHWKNLGFVGRIDAVHRTITALDLNVDGPVLSYAGAMRYAQGFVWVTGIPADPTLPQILFKIDPRTVTVVARVWSSSASFVNGIGYIIDSQGSLATFAEPAVEGGAPSRVARPAIHAPVAHHPRDAIERAVMHDFSLVYDYTRPNAAVVQYVEHQKNALILRQKLTVLARQLYSNVRVVITDVAVNGDRVSLSYSFLLGKTAAFLPLSAELTRVGNRWVVSADSICHLADVAGLGNC